MNLRAVLKSFFCRKSGAEILNELSR